MDMIILDRFQIGYDAEFLTGCRNVVRKYGMSAWLYEMINDASVAVATPSAEQQDAVPAWSVRYT